MSASKGGAFEKYLLYPDSETNWSKALYLIGQAKEKEGSQGTRQREDEVESMIWVPFPVLLGMLAQCLQNRAHIN